MPGKEPERSVTTYWITRRMSRDVKEQKMIDTSSITRPRPILALELTQNIPLEKIYVGILKEKRNISEAIKLITTASPGLGHLKRCSGNRLLLKRVEISEKELKDTLQSKGFDLSLLEEEFEILDLPSKPCKTKKQAEICAKIWPLNFHPDPTTELIISGDIFSAKKLSRIELLMRLTIDATRIESIGNSECNGSALIVDPKNGEPLALASSKLNKNPLWHGAMLAIDLVAKIQGGGAWDLKNENNPETSNSSSLPTKEKTKRKLEKNMPLCYPPSLSKIHFPEPEPLESPIKSNQKTKEKKEEEEKKDILSRVDNNPVNLTKTGPYLCTNFWVFLIQEPCALCAMALLHSRASKIFYGIKKTNGVLGSRALLHTTPGLNHRYQVWCGILEKECEAVCNEIKQRELKLD